MSQHRIITQLLAQVDGLKQKNLALKKLHRKVNWRKIATTNPPIERSSHCISVVGSVVFMLGGENVARTPIDSQLHTIDISATMPTWAVMEVNGTPPSERIAHAQCAQGGHTLWVFGGRQGIHMSEAPLDDLFKFDIASKTWTEVKAANPPCARSFHRMVSAGPYLYVFAGCAAKGRLNDLHRFDTRSAQWKQMPSSDAIAGRGGPCFYADDSTGDLFVVAGFAGQEMDDVHQFSAGDGSNVWKQVHYSGHLRPRSVCGATMVGGLVCVFGGEVEESNKGHEGAGGFADDVVVFDPKLGMISDSLPLAPSSDPVPCQRGWTAIDALGDSGFVLYGGLTGNDESPQRLGDLYVMEFA
jgi:hypothetical protein